MSQAPTLYDFQIALSQVDRGLDPQQLSMKVTRHPSETMARVWLRVLAYGWLWEERLTFGKGLGEPDAPDLECRDYTDRVTRWIRVGKADPAKVQRAVDQNSNAQVSVLFESADRMASFLAEAREAGTARVARAELAAVDEGFLASLSAIDSRRVKGSLTLVGDQFYADCEGQTFDGPLLRGVL